MSTKVGITLTAEDKTQAAFNSVTTSLGALKTRSDSLFSAFSGGVAGGLVTGLLGAGFSTYIQSAINDLDKLDESAERLGMSVESLSALNFAGRMNGLEFEDMTAALTKLSVKMQEAAAGSKEAGALFADIGVKVKDSAGNLKPAEQMLAEIADRFATFEDGAAKTALSVDMFGKSGAKLVPLLNGGADGLERMRKEAENLGGVIDAKLAKQAAEFNDNLDRLSVLSGTVAKSIAGELLPSLNKLASEFLAARSAGMGFWESMIGIGLSDPTKSPGQQIKSLTAEIDKLTASREAAFAQNRQDGGSIDTSDMSAELARLQRRREYFKAMQRMEALEGVENYGNEGRGKMGGSGKNEIVRTASGEQKAKTAAKEAAEATAEATAYAKAMESLAKVGSDANAATLDLTKSQRALFDLMTSAEWTSMPESWRQTAVAQFEQAAAAEQSAEATARLNRLLGETESSKIEAARDDMLALVGALEQGIITEGKYLEAVAARLGKGSDEIAKQKNLVDELGLTFTSAFENAVASGGKFSDVLKGLEQDILRLLARMAVTEPLGKAVQGVDWGGLAKSVVGWFGSTTANANGGVYNSPSLSAYSGGVYSTPQFFAFANGAGVFGEAGPEAIMPLRRGADGKLGVAAAGGGVVVNVINNSGAQTREERRSDGRGGTIIDIIVERAKNAVAADIGSGNGAVPAAMQGAYGLSRRAGAY